MARERVALTDKEEKILVQAQLMGLTTASMVKIGNRLKALENEREIKANIDAITSKYTLSAITNGWRIVDAAGFQYDFTNRVVSYGNRISWGSRKEIFWDVTVNKPGTRYVERVIKRVLLRTGNEYPAKFCPEKSKEILGMMRTIDRGTLEK
jgi:hypothetical protein